MGDNINNCQIENEETDELHSVHRQCVLTKKTGAYQIALLPSHPTEVHVVQMF